MLTLYHARQSRSVRPRWLLEEMEVPYDVVRLDLSAGEQRRPEYLRINPTGKVPALVDGDLVLFESAAICQYLADRFPEQRMAPPLGTAARGLYYQWMHFAMSGLEPPLLTIFMHTVRRPEAERVPALVEEARPQFAEALGVLEPVLAGRPFLLGDALSAPDVMVASMLGWARAMRLFGDDRPIVRDYVRRLTARPAYHRASAD